MALCRMGREYNPSHRTCRSCERQGIKVCKQTKKPRKIHTTGINNGAFVCTKDLKSPNYWTNKQNGRRIYQGERKAWERVLVGAYYLFGPAKGKRRLTVTRFVPNRNHFMRDKTNREGSLKPLEDALVNLKVLVDDRDEFLDRLDLKQEIDPGHPRVEILIEDIA